MLGFYGGVGGKRSRTSKHAKELVSYCESWRHMLNLFRGWYRSESRSLSFLVGNHSGLY